jgi:L-seryl-tRNA(Ser) seleniumtransferase
VSKSRVDPRRALPSVNALLDSESVRALLAHAPRPLVVDAVRRALDEARQAPEASPRGAAEWAEAVGRVLAEARRPSLRRVLNATGVVLHTNLGRAPLAADAIDAIARVASGFSNLEYDVERGQRGSRHVHCAALLRELTGAEDALVLNNCASALVLALHALARGREAVISRGELVEIGGSFRIPDIMGTSGARLVEIGTTNRTHLDDYRNAIGANTGAILKVHRSNFAVAGFVAEVGVAELAELAAPLRIPVIHDLGSGLLIALDDVGLSGEPTARDALRAGATLVMMSGDKLLGGPQAGLVVGKRQAIDALRSDPLARALRVDKLTLAALEATLALYREPERARREIPALAMLTAPLSELRSRAERIAHALATTFSLRVHAKVVESDASVGGGAFPAARIPSVALALGEARDAADLEHRLRLGEPAVIGRIADGRLLLDVRTMLPRDDALLIAALGAALAPDA